jgi:hypothetical protein
MTDALKAAVRRAWYEVYAYDPPPDVARELTSSLARRGVVVAGGDLLVAMGSLHQASYDIARSTSFVELVAISRKVVSLFSQSATVAERDAHVVTDQNVVANSIAAGESPAPNREPGMGWKLSDEAKAQIEEINRPVANLDLAAWPFVAQPETPAPKPARKVVQITGDCSELHALCDDGTMWFLEANGWHPTPPIPQPGEKQ